MLMKKHNFRIIINLSFVSGENRRGKLGEKSHNEWKTFIIKMRRWLLLFKKLLSEKAEKESFSEFLQGANWKIGNSMQVHFVGKMSSFFYN